MSTMKAVVFKEKHRIAVEEVPKPVPKWGEAVIQRIVTTLCPGGRERMRRLMAMIAHDRVDLSRLVTHHFALDDTQEAYDLFSHQRDGVLKVALYPDAARMPSGRRAAAAALA